MNIYSINFHTMFHIFVMVMFHTMFTLVGRLVLENLAPLQDKQELLKQFVQHGENIESIETTLTLSREQVGSVQRNRELLTIGEMKAKGFSQQLGDLLDVLFLSFF